MNNSLKRLKGNGWFVLRDGQRGWGRTAIYPTAGLCYLSCTRVSQAHRTTTSTRQVLSNCFVFQFSSKFPVFTAISAKAHRVSCPLGQHVSLLWECCHGKAMMEEVSLCCRTCIPSFIQPGGEKKQSLLSENTTYSDHSFHLINELEANFFFLFLFWASPPWNSKDCLYVFKNSFLSTSWRLSVKWTGGELPHGWLSKPSAGLLNHF